MEARHTQVLSYSQLILRTSKRSDRKKSLAQARLFLYTFEYMKLSISIMAHPEREQYFDYFKKLLGDVPFAIDTGCGLLENCKNAWKLHDPSADYHLVLQDDAILCENFRARALEVLEKADGLPVSFIYINPIPFIKGAKLIYEQGYIKQAGLSGGVALCLPVALISRMLSHYDTLRLPHDDHRIGNFLITNAIPIYSPIPSLIDHRVGNKSVFWKRTSLHQAYDFCEKPTKRPA